MTANAMPGLIVSSPARIAGLAFVEFGGTEPDPLQELLVRLGFAPVTEEDGFRVLRQGPLTVVVETRPGTPARRYAELHGPTLSGLGVWVGSAERAWSAALDAGMKPRRMAADGNRHIAEPVSPFAVGAIGGTTLSFLDHTMERNGIRRHSGRANDQTSKSPELRAIDHITFNVEPGKLAYWTKMLRMALGFHEVFRADLRTGPERSSTCVSQSPCGTFALACNEPASAGSPLIEQMRRFNGEGVQHIAFACEDLVATTQILRNRGFSVLPAPSLDWDALTARLGDLPYDPDALRHNMIHIDGERDGGQQRLLLQHFTKPILGPVFFEFVERRNFPQGFVQRTAENLLNTVSATSAD